MARHDPTGHSADDVPAAVFPDPFGPYPDRPYPGADSHVTVEDQNDPPTDPGFDPFAPEAFRFPERPWYRKKPAMAAIIAITAAVLAIIVAAVLLVALDPGNPGRSPVDTSTTVTTAPTTTAPTTTELTGTSSPEPPPPPPPSEGPPPDGPPPPAETGSTEAPQAPRQTQNDRPNVTTPQTRGPDISVRPTHRPAFPNQSG